MYSPASLSGFVLTFFRVLGSTVVGKHSAVLEGLEGSVTDLDDSEGDTPGETLPAAESWGALGLVVRPRPPETIQGEMMNAEGYGARTPAGMVPFARRDLRLNRRFPAPKPGSVALVGYGGGFLSFDDAAGDTSLGTLYVPYSRSGNGVVSKAHMISIGKDGNGTPFVGIISGEGPRVTLLGTQAVVANADGSARLEVNSSGVNAVGPFKAASGADLGGPTSEALAKYAALADLVTKLMLHVGAITTQLNAAGPVAGASGALTTTLTPLIAAAGVVTAPATGGTVTTKGA
jgi:hypothetical protein